MRIAYFAHVNAGRGSGVVAKLAAQLAAWRREGHDATLFLATSDRDVAWASVLGHVIIARYHDGPSRLRAMFRLVEAVRDAGPDVVYLRWELFYPPMLRLPSGVPLVVEINTNDLREYALGPRLRATYNRLTRGLLLRRADAFVFANGWDLARSPSFQRFEARPVVITNGIDLSAYPSLPADAEGPPRLVFVGIDDTPWNGIDKLITLASMRPGWCFDFVGITLDPGQRRPNIRTHGQLDRPAVLEVLRQADVGVGPLALHRKGMEEVCTLKVREYLAVGLPVLYGGHDPDADAFDPYVMRIANTETNVVDEADRIDAFVNGARGLRVPRSLIEHLDVAVKERQRLEVFGEVARR